MIRKQLETALYDKASEEQTDHTEKSGIFN